MYVCMPVVCAYVKEDIITRDTLTANRGPNAVSVDHLKGWWSTIRLKPRPLSRLEDVSQYGAHTGPEEGLKKAATST